MTTETPTRRTKIVATLGPATDVPGMLEKLIAEGVDVVRLNLSHGMPDDHRARANAVRVASAAAGREVGILADLQGPKIRIETFANGPVELLDGAHFVLDCRPDAPLAMRRASASAITSCRRTCMPPTCCYWTTDWSR